MVVVEVQSTHHTKLYLASMEPKNSSVTQQTMVVVTVAQYLQQTMLCLASIEAVALPAAQHPLLRLVVVQSYAVENAVLTFLGIINFTSNIAGNVVV